MPDCTFFLTFYESYSQTMISYTNLLNYQNKHYQSDDQLLENFFPETVLATAKFLQTAQFSLFLCLGLSCQPKYSF
jgi:hypothetical protein